MIIIKTNRQNKVGMNIKKGTNYEEIMVGAIEMIKFILEHSDYTVNGILEDIKGVLNDGYNENK